MSDYVEITEYLNAKKYQITKISCNILTFIGVVVYFLGSGDLGR